MGLKVISILKGSNRYYEDSLYSFISFESIISHIKIIVD